MEIELNCCTLCSIKGELFYGQLAMTRQRGVSLSGNVAKATALDLYKLGVKYCFLYIFVHIYISLRIVYPPDIAKGIKL